MRKADYGWFGYSGMFVDGAFNFAVPKRWPETLITSSTRPVIQKYPSSSRLAPSPVKYMPLKVEIGLFEAFVIFINSAHLTRPAVQNNQIAFGCAVKFAAFIVNQSRLNAKGGKVALKPGLVVVAPGSGVIRCPPVSVCHHVSTIGQRPSPTMW